MKKEKSFEKAMSELSKIAEKLSDGNLPLDDTIKLYEEGREISTYCRKLLDDYDARIDKLDEVKNDDEQE